MAPQSKVTIMSNDASKKLRTLEDLKKAQKCKQAAKRASAAAQFKVKKAIIVVDVSKEESMGTIHAQDSQTSDAAQVHDDISAQTIAVVQCPADDALSSQTVDLQAHRKALEAALYENMETPRQMLARVKFAVIVDAEYHHYPEDDEFLGDEDEVRLKCRDDNRFVITPIVGNLLEVTAACDALLADGDVFASLTAEVVKSQQENTPTTRSLTMDEVFAKTKSEGVSGIGSSESTASRTLESVELEQTKSFFTIDQLFAVASQSGKTVLRAVNMNESSSARSVESIEREMFMACLNSQAAPFAPFVDPAIISSQVKKKVPNINQQKSAFKIENSGPDAEYTHSEASAKLKSLIGVGSSENPSSSTNSQSGSRRSSYHATGTCTPLTRYSASPPPSASQEVPCFFNEHYPTWMKTFDEPHYTCAQPFYVWPMAHPWPVYRPHANRWHPTSRV